MHYNDYNIKHRTIELVDEYSNIVCLLFNTNPRVITYFLKIAIKCLLLDAWFSRMVLDNNDN